VELMNRVRAAAGTRRAVERITVDILDGSIALNRQLIFAEAKPASCRPDRQLDDSVPSNEGVSGITTSSPAPPLKHAVGTASSNGNSGVIG